MKCMIFKIMEDYAICINEYGETINIRLESIPQNSREDDIIGIKEMDIYSTTQELKNINNGNIELEIWE